MPKRRTVNLTITTRHIPTGRIVPPFTARNISTRSADWTEHQIIEFGKSRPHLQMGIYRTGGKEVGFTSAGAKKNYDKIFGKKVVKKKKGGKKKK